MRQGTESRRGTTATRGGGLPAAFWLAQGFVGLALVLLALRHRGDDEGVSPPKAHAGQGAPASPEPARAGRPLSIEPAAASAPPPRPRELRGAPYVPEEYQSRVRVLEDYVQWTLDSRELVWLLANRRQVLAGDLETDPEPEGGLRIRGIRQGSFGEHRGLRVGDVLLDINGQDLDSPEDLESFLRDPAYSGAGGWRVRLKRGPEILLLDYGSAS